MQKLAKLRDKVDQRGQTSAAIKAEELRGQLKRFCVKQVETGNAGEFERKPKTTHSSGTSASTSAGR